MSLSRWSLLAWMLGVFALASPAAAGAGAKPGGPKATAHVKASAQKGHAAKPVRTPNARAASQGTSAKPAKALKPAKPPKPGSTTTTQTTVRANGKANGKKAGTSVATGTTTGSTIVGGSTTTIWRPTNAVAEKLSTKPNLLTKARAVLPPGTDLNLATANFKNFGQFNAAVNAARNHGISFVELRALMTGTTLAGTPTGQPILSLGQALQQLKPGIDATAAAQTATAQSNAEIAAGSATTSTSTTGTATSRKPTKSNKTGKSE